MNTDRMTRRRCTGAIAGAVAALSLSGPVSAQLGGDGGGNNNNKKNKKRRRPPQRVPFDISGQGKTRFKFDLKPTGSGGQIAVMLMSYNEKYKRYVKAMDIGTFRQALNKTTSGIPLRPGKYAIELMGGAFSYSVTVEHGSGEGDDVSYSKIAGKSGKV